MRENRPSGSEGGGAETNRLFLPLYIRRASSAKNVSSQLAISPLRNISYWLRFVVTPTL